MKTSSNIAEKKTDLAFLIGINEYANGIPALKTPIADVRMVAHHLHTEFGFSTTTIEDPNQQEMLDFLGKRTAPAGPCRRGPGAALFCGPRCPKL